MTIPLWVTEAADAFWQAAGEYEPFPRDLRLPIALSLPVAIVSLPRLRLYSVDEWLRHQGIICGFHEQDRSLRACLVAQRGQGLIFLDGSDPVDEQRFSLAHEVAHYLRDYWLPRQRSVELLGPAALEVLDGDRLPRIGERIDAVLSRVELSYHVHLLDRAPNGVPANGVIALAEHSADLLGCELLAPAECVLHGLLALPLSEQREVIVRRLVDVFGLPAAQAEGYVARLLPPPVEDSLLRRLGITP